MQANIPPSNIPATPSPALIPTKSVFQSKTFWGAVLTAIAAIAPVIAQNIEDYQQTGKVDASSVAQIVVVLSTTGLTVLGRINASTAIYTPDGLPGPNKARS